LLIVECPEAIAEGLRERLPVLVFERRPAELLDRLPRFISELIVGPFRARVAHDGEPLGEHLLTEEVVQSREDLAVRQFDRCAEDDDDLRLRRCDLHGHILSLAQRESFPPLTRWTLIGTARG